jgi:RNA polymerase sigma-70 factor (ECF subfamily)
MAYRALPGFRADSQLSTWLYRIAYRTAIKVRRRYPASSQAEQPEQADTYAPGPVQDAAAGETNEAIWAAVARLDPDQAAAIELFYRRQMSVEDVAAVMEKPVGTVKTLLFRARERLRTLLKPLEDRP